MTCGRKLAILAVQVLRPESCVDPTTKSIKRRQLNGEDWDRTHELPPTMRQHGPRFKVLARGSLEVIGETMVSSEVFDIVARYVPLTS